MSAPILEHDSVDEQLRSLTTIVQQLRQEVHELRCDVAYWKSMHARAVERNTKLQAELDQAKVEIRQLKAERFGKQSEKQSAGDRSNLHSAHLGRDISLKSRADQIPWGARR